MILFLYFKNIKAFIYGKDKVFFSKILDKKIKYKVSKNLNNLLLLICKDIKNDFYEKNVITKNFS